MHAIGESPARRKASGGEDAAGDGRSLIVENVTSP